jgi:hypothetical protein
MIAQQRQIAKSKSVIFPPAQNLSATKRFQAHEAVFDQKRGPLAGNVTVDLDFRME